MNTKNKIAPIPFTVSLMGIAAISSKALGLLRDILIAGKWGTGTEAVAFDIASRLPLMLFDIVIGGAVTAVFIPIFTRIDARGGRDRAMRFTSSYINLISAVTGILSVTGIIFAEDLIHVIAPDISGSAESLAVQLTRIMFPMIIFAGIAYSFVGILQSLGEYRLPSLIGIFSAGTAVLYIITLGDKFGVSGLAAAMLTGWILQTAVQIPKLRSLGWYYTPQLRAADPHITEALRSALPVLAGTWAYPICNIAGTRYASGISAGIGVSALGYASRLYTSLSGIFVFICSGFIFPKLASASASGDDRREKMITAKAMRMIIYITAPIGVILPILAPHITAVIYERGMFTSADTELTAKALSGYAMGTVFFGLNEITVKALFAKGNVKVPMISSLLSTVLCIALLPIFTKLMGIFGISLAVSASTAVNFTLNFTALKRRGSIFTKSDTVVMMKYAISSLITGIAAISISAAVNSPALTLILCVPAGTMIYLLLTYISRKV